MPIIELKDLESKEIIPGYTAKFVHTDNVTIAYFDITAGHSLPLHAHINEQISHVLEGQLQITIDNQTVVLEAGKVAIIPSNIAHSAYALTNCKVLDVFNPPREDYK